VTAYELRKHLADRHGIVMWGASGGLLEARHEADHRTGLVDHDHDEGPH
jgi:hypothetical protein